MGNLGIEIEILGIMVVKIPTFYCNHWHRIDRGIGLCSFTVLEFNVSKCSILQVTTKQNFSIYE